MLDHQHEGLLETFEIWYTKWTGSPREARRKPTGSPWEHVVKPAPFAYHRARSVDEAVALLAELGDEAKILAGGLSLVPMMNFRLARPSALIDVTRITGLSYLRADGDGLRIGALTTHRTVETSRDPAVTGGFGVLPRSAHWIGHYPIRSRGTFGGSIAHADPASEWCLLAVLLDAQVILIHRRSMHVFPLTCLLHPGILIMCKIHIICTFVME
jgi:carbon-monoxide dehydrogenase medium subunit